jgi:hypothetical protein
MVGEAVLIACHVLNRVLTKNIDITPYDGWKERKPSLYYLRTWGYLGIVSVPINKKHKLRPKTVDCIIFGYAHHSTPYKFLVIKLETPNILVDSLIELWDVTFFENIFLMKNAYSLPSSSNEFIPEPMPTIESIINPHGNEEDDSGVAPKRSKRQKVAKFFGEDFTVYLIDDTPTTIAEAYASLDAKYLKDAICSEMDSITAKWYMGSNR